jgi:hypothetical protein
MANIVNIVSLLTKDKSLTPFVFYSDFLKSVADFYLDSNSKNKEFELKLIEGSDMDLSSSKYFIDPITLPLLLSLFNQLKKFHRRPIKLYLSNTPVTIHILEYLFRSDFFYVAGNNTNPNFPIGRQILSYDETYLGGYKGKNIRSDHKLRCYTLNDDNLKNKILENIEGEPAQRDYLVEFYTYKVKDHFYDLLFENENSNHLTNDFIEILAELITNGVLHSKSDAFALMFSDRFKTKFSISDNGIGLYESLNTKKNSNQFYEKFELLKTLSKNFPLKVDDKIKNSVLILFETLYYSMLKDRQGLFDLMCNVVINCSGYFRLHTDNAQIIVSARMLNELEKLNETREKILKLHNTYLFELINNKEFIKSMSLLVESAKEQLIELANSIFKKYSEDTRFSAIRLFEVKFRGVHIEVEIPNSNEDI